jgi:hypothetical protein
MAEVVRFAGGWLFDQVMAGWDVTVLTADHPDARPLEILGARAADLETVLARQVRGSCLQAIAVRAELYDSDARVRRMVREALEEPSAEVRLWDEGWRADLDGAAGPVRHRLSVAARAFKAQALAAAAVPADPGADTEVFRSALGHPALLPARLPGIPGVGARNAPSCCASLATSRPRPEDSSRCRSGWPSVGQGITGACGTATLHGGGDTSPCAVR